ncbi:hypothetical protein EON65_56605 [archaeon]|nr:MAG: hypothetical protein EON65_56605 [archaeon]
MLINASLLLRPLILTIYEWYMYRQYWMNYKFLKKKIKGILVANGGQKPHDTDPHPNQPTQPQALSSSATEVEFFKLLRKELKKTCDFFEKAQEEFRIRWERIWESYQMLHEKGVVHDKYTWTRLLSACVKFYKDVLLLENFAIMNYCGFSKILKKHDKCTG